jgi:nitrogen fixation NifU-like protein
MFRVIHNNFRLISRKYHFNIVEHYENPRNIGKLDKTLKNVGTAIVGSPACGDVLQLQILVENDVIVSSKYKIFGCGSAIAAGSVTTEFITGKKIKDVINITNSDIAGYLKLPPIKLHCSMLAEDAIKEAIKDYKNKNK